MLGFHCCTSFSLAVARRGYSLAAGHKLLTVVGSVLVEIHGAQASGIVAYKFSGFGTQA